MTPGNFKGTAYTPTTLTPHQRMSSIMRRKSRHGGFVNMEIIGLDDVALVLASMSALYAQAMGGAMLDWMQGVIAESKDRWVPIDTAALKDSGFARGPFREGSEIVVEGGFGPSKDERNRRGGEPKSMEEYALAVHEENIPHQHGTWKYLQIPFVAREHKLAGVIKTAMGY